MSLIKCPECGNSISDKAAKCPHCGVPVEYFLSKQLSMYIKKVEQQRSKRVKTITGEYLRSAQEVQIASFLYLNGLDYEYERVYPFESPSSNKKYTPDSYITQGEHTAWLEHYALTESGYSNVFSPEQRAKYMKSIRDRRSVHQAHKTTLIETWSLYNDCRSLMDYLKESLKAEGFGRNEGSISEDKQTPDQTIKKPQTAKFEPKQPKIRRPGTGCIFQISEKK